MAGYLVLSGDVTSWGSHAHGSVIFFSNEEAARRVFEAGKAEMEREEFYMRYEEYRMKLVRIEDGDSLFDLTDAGFEDVDSGVTLDEIVKHNPNP